MLRRRLPVIRFRVRPVRAIPTAARGATVPVSNPVNRAAIRGPSRVIACPPRLQKPNPAAASSAGSKVFSAQSRPQLKPLRLLTVNGTARVAKVAVKVIKAAVVAAAVAVVVVAPKAVIAKRAIPRVPRARAPAAARARANLAVEAAVIIAAAAKAIAVVVVAVVVAVAVAGAIAAVVAEIGAIVVPAVIAAVLIPAQKVNRAAARSDSR
jgi:hypothetical protein